MSEAKAKRRLARKNYSYTYSDSDRSAMAAAVNEIIAEVKVPCVGLVLDRFPGKSQEWIRILLRRTRVAGLCPVPAGHSAKGEGIVGDTESEKLWIQLRISAMQLAREIRGREEWLAHANERPMFTRGRNHEWASRQPRRNAELL